METCKRGNPENEKTTAQTALGKVWKKMMADFPAADELEEEDGARSRN